MSEWIGAPPRMLDELTAFDAMRNFLEACWERGGKQSGDLAMLLSNLDRGHWASGMPLDPAQWSDWRNAVNKVLTEAARSA